MEDSARRAVFAGLEISSEITKLQERLKKSQETTINFHIGIHTGIVVTEEVKSSVSSERHSIVGNVPRVAAGLAALAEPGSVVVSGATRQIVGDAFAYHSLGTHSGKAIGAMSKYSRSWGERRGDRSRSEGAEYQTPLIGREYETGLLNQRWERPAAAWARSCWFVLSRGLAKRVCCRHFGGTGRGGMQSFNACSTYHQNQPFYPIGEFLKRLAKLNSEDSDESKLDKLEGLLREF